MMIFKKVEFFIWSIILSGALGCSTKSQNEADSSLAESSLVRTMDSLSPKTTISEGSGLTYYEIFNLNRSRGRGNFQNEVIKNFAKILSVTKGDKDTQAYRTVYAGGLALMYLEDQALGVDLYTGQSLYAGFRKTLRLKIASGYDQQVKEIFAVNFSFTDSLAKPEKYILHVDYYQDLFAHQTCQVAGGGDQSKNRMDWNKDYPLTLPQAHLAVETLEFILRSNYFIKGYFPSMLELQKAFERIYSNNYQDINKLTNAEILFLGELISSGVTACLGEGRADFKPKIEDIHFLLLSAFPQLDFDVSNPKLLSQNIGKSKEEFLNVILKSALDANIKFILTALSSLAVKGNSEFAPLSIAGNGNGSSVTPPITVTPTTPVPPVTIITRESQAKNILVSASKLNVSLGENVSFTAENASAAAIWWYVSPTNQLNRINCSAGPVCSFTIPASLPVGSYQVFVRDTNPMDSSVKESNHLVLAVASSVSSTNNSPPVTLSSAGVPDKIAIERMSNNSGARIISPEKFEALEWKITYVAPFVNVNIFCYVNYKNSVSVTRQELTDACKTTMPVNVKATGKIKGTSKILESNLLIFN